ncbi:conserved hypothetical protein [Histoplasma mississippiense (nom. inval.)]|uniref:conserved hypothetical protein n=1 Tax=Ajellomyces capsulatus (strain NAm1 / WU24) TaxID=2059318 RepID=UPI000157CD19|nr:conserved hypothetical protein [Histoplasma mississippiense (nom. inval.)]EDN10359.1 conserved hypothetical protein [Histoplasma mississippiense (nom. inval.)]
MPARGVKHEGGMKIKAKQKKKTRPEVFWTGLFNRIRKHTIVTASTSSADLLQESKEILEKHMLNSLSLSAFRAVARLRFGSGEIVLAPSRANPRLSLISRHLDQRLPLPALNTPFSTERTVSVEPDDIEYKPLQRTPPPNLKNTAAPTSNHNEPREKMSTQEHHSTLLIPGPIEFDDAVLHSMSHYAESHVGPAFVKTFGECLTLLRSLFQTTSPASQPFLIAGSGTLGWDLVSANLIEREEEALVLHTGYFGDSFADCLETYGAKVTQLKAPVGEQPSLGQIEKALAAKSYKLLTVTHVDTSTGVLADIKSIAALARRRRRRGACL